MNHQVKFEFTTHHRKPVIFIRFKSFPELNKRVKELVGVRWSWSEQAWYVLDVPQNRQKFNLEPKPIGQEVLHNIHPVNQPAFQAPIATLQLKAYSPSTIKTYRNEFAQLLNLMQAKNVAELDATKLRSYLLYCINTLKLTENTLHSRINAVKFYFEQVLKREKIFLKFPDRRNVLYYQKLLIPKTLKRFSRLLLT